MPNFNCCTFIGHTTRDPQMSYLPNQTPVVDIGLAVNHHYKTAGGEKKEETCFLDCRCFGKQAETLNQYVQKGDAILLQGRLQFDTWEGKDGAKHSKHRLFIEKFTFMGGKKDSQPEPRSQASQAAPEPAESEDIPF